MELIIVGCGRMGAELAMTASAKGHKVTVIDDDRRAFERLGAGFHGRTVQGRALDREVLTRAEIENADGLAAVTASDATNLTVALMAVRVFHLANVIARVYDPRRLPAFEALGVQAMNSSSWGAERIAHLLTHPGMVPLSTVGHGEVTVVEMRIPEELEGISVEQFSQRFDLIACAQVRGGQARLCRPESKLSGGELLVVTVATSTMGKLESMLTGREAP